MFLINNNIILVKLQCLKACGYSSNLSSWKHHSHFRHIWSARRSIPIAISLEISYLFAEFNCNIFNIIHLNLRKRKYCADWITNETHAKMDFRSYLEQLWRGSSWCDQYCVPLRSSKRACLGHHVLVKRIILILFLYFVWGNIANYWGNRGIWNRVLFCRNHAIPAAIKTFIK